jgi:hypothetical protein
LTQTRFARLCRTAGALALGASALLVGYGGGTAQAASTFPVTGISWYWASQAKPVGAICPPDPVPPNPALCVPPLGSPPAPVPTPDVQAGDFAVAAKNDGIDKVAALHIDLASVPAGATVQDAVLRLIEDPGSTGAAQTTAKIFATPTDYFADGATAQPLDQAPNMEKSPQTAGVRATQSDATTAKVTNVWSFDVTGQLNACLAANEASCPLGLRPAFLQSGTYQVVWYGSAAATNTTFSDAVKPTVTATVVAGTGSTTTTAFIPPDTTPVQPSVNLPPTPEQQSFGQDFVSVGSPLPAVSTPTSTTTTIARKAASAPRIRPIAHAKRALPLAFFLAALGAVALFGSGMVALGDLGEPVPARRGSVVRALERRAGGRPVA